MIPRIYKLGGVVTPMKESAEDWIKTWRATKAQRDPQLLLRVRLRLGPERPVLAAATRATGRIQSSTRSSHSTGSVTFERQRSGERVFDITKDGVAHYGLFPDWWEDIRRVGGEAAVERHGARGGGLPESWERVNGIGFGCKSESLRFTRRGLGRLHLRDSAARLLRRGGQPKVRGNSAWSWCVRGKQNRGKRVAAALTSAGKVALVGRNANVPKKVPAGAHRIGNGLFVRGAGPKARFVYRVRGGRVRSMAVATRAASKNRTVLRRYLALAKLR